jgi:hypothetical protein
MGLDTTAVACRFCSCNIQRRSPVTKQLYSLTLPLNTGGTFAYQPAWGIGGLQSINVGPSNSGIILSACLVDLNASNFPIDIYFYYTDPRMSLTDVNDHEPFDLTVQSSQYILGVASFSSYSDTNSFQGQNYRGASTLRSIQIPYACPGGILYFNCVFRGPMITLPGNEMYLNLILDKD